MQNNRDAVFQQGNYGWVFFLFILLSFAFMFFYYG